MAITLQDIMARAKGPDVANPKHEAMKGLIEAIHAKDHEAACDWFDKCCDPVEGSEEPSI